MFYPEVALIFLCFAQKNQASVSPDYPLDFEIIMCYNMAYKRTAVGENHSLGIINNKWRILFMNNKKNLKETVDEALNFECKTAGSEEARRILNLAGDAVKLADIDEQYLIGLVENIIKEYEEDKKVLKRLVNPLLGIFGLKIVRRKDGSGREYAKNKETQEPIINADIDELRKILHNIASVADHLVNAGAARVREIESHLNNAVRDAENAKNRLGAEQSGHARQETETLKYIQRMLAERGKDNPPTADEAFGQLLEILDVTFSWEPDGDPAAFQTYTISDESKIGISLPCLLKNNDIAVKGLIYAVKQ
jgi:hypothetical protein